MNIIVLCGGLSAERDVSISSGTQISRALLGRGHDVVLIDLFFGYQGSYEEPTDIFGRGEELPSFSVSESEPDLDAIKAARKQDNNSLIGDNVLELCGAADIVFLALHGDVGENGKIQAVLDIAGIKYTGSGYLGSALAMNKELSKKLFDAAGIKTPEGITLRCGDTPYLDVGFPCVVKPCSGGSSVGTSIVESRADYHMAVEDAFRYEDNVIVERYIKGREFTVGVLGSAAMPVVEILPKSGFYDYKNKYQSGLTVELCPAPIDPEQTEKLQRIALAAFDALRIDVYARMDCIAEESGDVYCLEMNTLPGMTPTSLIPQMGEAMGLGFVELCERIIELSMEKYR